MTWTKIDEVTTGTWTVATAVTTPRWERSIGSYKILKEDTYAVLQESYFYLLDESSDIDVSWTKAVEGTTPTWSVIDKVTTPIWTNVDYWEGIDYVTWDDWDTDWDD